MYPPLHLESSTRALLGNRSRSQVRRLNGHQGLKQHIDLSISRLSTYKALRDEIINYSRVRRTWTDPNANAIWCSAFWTSIRRVAEVSLRKEARAKREKRRRPASLMENSDTSRKGTRRWIAERWRQTSMQAGATRAASQRVSMHSQRQARHSLPRKRALHQAWQAPSHCNRWCRCTAITRVTLQNPGSSTRSCRPRRHFWLQAWRGRIRVTGFWIRLDILSLVQSIMPTIFHYCHDLPTYQFEQRHWRQRGMHWSKTSRVSAWECWTRSL